MAKIANRVLASALAVVALFFGVRAAAIFWVVSSGPMNFIPAPSPADGGPVCPPQEFLSREAELIFTILGSLIVIALARLLWHRSSSTQH
jgi:hypothetical protein